MRVGILTFPKSPSFGASLQMFGLYQALNSLGVDAEIINYRNTYMTQKRHIVSHRSNSLKSMVLSVIDLPEKRKFKKFEQQLEIYPKRIICEKDDLQDIANRYDFLICGSDQVWNPNITGEDLNYFFSFCQHNTKKISYAASFGVNELNPEFSQKVKEQLTLFRSISVREEQGAEIVSGLLGKSCDIVLDPSMLISKNIWRSFEKKVNGLPPRYIAKFIFNHDEVIEQKIAELSKKSGLPVITVGGNLLSKFKNGIYTGPIGPNEWLYVLDNADYVVTDSFHGAAFSIIFNKNLYVSLASSTNSRLITLVNTFGLNDCILCEKMHKEEINYQIVQKIMDEKKEKSYRFLKNALGIVD